MTALIHLTHSICSRASEKCLVPDKHDRLSSKQFIPPRTRNSLSHSLFAFSKRGLIPEKFFSDGVFNNLTHNSGSASAITSVFAKETSLFSLEIFRHMDFALKAILQFPLTFQQGLESATGFRLILDMQEKASENRAHFPETSFESSAGNAQTKAKTENLCKHWDYWRNPRRGFRSSALMSKLIFTGK